MQQSHPWVYIQKYGDRHLQEMPALPCALRLSPQEPGDWKAPSCQSAEQRIQEGWHTYTMGREQPPQRGGDRTMCRLAARDYRSGTGDAATY